MVINSNEVLHRSLTVYKNVSVKDSKTNVLFPGNVNISNHFTNFLDFKLCLHQWLSRGAADFSNRIEYQTEKQLILIMCAFYSCKFIWICTDNTLWEMINKKCKTHHDTPTPPTHTHEKVKIKTIYNKSRVCLLNITKCLFLTLFLEEQ